MRKQKINVTMDKDLIEFVKTYAKTQRTTVSEIFTQFILYLKRTKEKDATDIILSDPDFKETLLNTVSKLRAGTTEWRDYGEVF